MVHGVHGPRALRPVKEGSSHAAVCAMTHHQTQTVGRVSVRPEKHETATKTSAQVTRLNRLNLNAIFHRDIRSLCDMRCTDSNCVFLNDFFADCKLNISWLQIYKKKTNS